MKPVDIFEKFVEIMPDSWVQDVWCWFPNGKNSIRLRSHTKKDFIFTYHNKNTWRFETVESFLESIKVEV